MQKAIQLALSLMLLIGITLNLTACTDDQQLQNLIGKNFETKVYDVGEAFNNIDIVTDTTDIELCPSDDAECKVVAFDKKNVDYVVSVEDGTLRIRVDDKSGWFERLFSLSDATLTVYLPEKAYSLLSISESTGNISVANDFSFTDIDIDISTGNTDLYASTSGHIDIKGSTGNIYVKDVNCGSLDIEVSTGDVTVKNLECLSDVEIEVSTGDVKLENASFGSLSTKGDTGHFTANNMTSSGNVLIERSTGKVNIDAAEISGNLITETTTGDTNICNAICNGDVNMTVSTGNTTITNVECKNLTTVGDTGLIDMVDVVASSNFNIERSTGDVTFTRCDASEITFLTDTGDVRGTLLSNKIFIYDTDTGDVELPESTTGGKCKITTDTGDIVISIEN